MKGLAFAAAGLLLLSQINPTYDQLFDGSKWLVLAAIVIGVALLGAGICAAIGSLATRCRL